MEEKELETLSPILEARDLHKSYGKHEVLKGVSFSVYPGEVFGFIGKNGAGKSTTIDCLVGLKNVDSGDILIDGIDARKDPLDAKMEIGYVPSEPVAYDVMTGNEYLQFVASSYLMYQEAFDANMEFLKKKNTYQMMLLLNHQYFMIL